MTQCSVLKMFNLQLVAHLFLLLIISWCGTALLMLVMKLTCFRSRDSCMFRFWRITSCSGLVSAENADLQSAQTDLCPRGHDAPLLWRLGQIHPASCQHQQNLNCILTLLINTYHLWLCKYVYVYLCVCVRKKCQSLIKLHFFSFFPAQLFGPNISFFPTSLNTAVTLRGGDAARRWRSGCLI